MGRMGAASPVLITVLHAAKPWGKHPLCTRKIMQDSCKIIARCNMSLQGTRRCSTASRSVRRWPSPVAYCANPPNAHPFTNKVRPGR